MTKQTKAATKPEWDTQTSHLLVHQWNIIMEHNATSVRQIPAFVARQLVSYLGFTRQQTVAATRLSLKNSPWEIRTCAISSQARHSYHTSQRHNPRFPTAAARVA